MKKLGLTIALLLMFSIFCRAQSNIIYGNISSLGFVGRTNLDLQLSIITPKHRKINNIQISDDPVPATTDMSGNYSFTNIAFGYYSLTASDSSGTRWPVLVFTDTTGSNNMSSLINYNVAIPPNSASNYYSIAQINQMFQSLTIPNAITNAVATNAGVLTVSGATLFIPTNAPANTNALTTAQQAILNSAITNAVGTNTGTVTISGGTLFVPTNSAGGVPGVSGTGGIVGTTNGGGGVSFSLYVAPVISSFVNDQNSIEQGATVTSTVLTWVLSGGAITSQSLNNSIGSMNIALRTTNHSSSYTTARTYTLTVSDGTTTPTASTTITFYSKLYWGASAQTASTITDGQIIALSGAFATSRATTQTISTASTYIFFCYPASFGAATFTVNGFPDAGWTLVTRNFVNASGGTVSYNIYQHTLATIGSFTVQVQ